MQPQEKKKVRAWVDGCFDITHYGHFNALRQARAMCDELVVGVHSDAEILKNKGPTVMNEKERYAVVAACKWVDQVVEDAPYFTTVAYLDKYNCDFCVHGSDCYQEVKDHGRYKECKRTVGISTTELVGRMLLMTKDHHARDRSMSRSSNGDAPPFAVSKGFTAPPAQFFATSQKIAQFSEGKEPKPSDKVVYLQGGFDLFHLGHIELLKSAKAQGDFLIVGVYDDQTINSIKGSNYPVMNIYERVLSVMACRYVDEVILGAPYKVTKEILEKVYKVSVVVSGKSDMDPDVDGSDPFELPKKLGIYKQIETPYSKTMTTETVISRILDNRKLYEERNRRKMEKAKLEETMK